METILMMMGIMTIYKDKTTVCKTKPVIRKIKLLSTILLTTFVMVILTGCVKDELNNTPHPNKGAVRVTTHWTELSKDAVQPKSYLLRITSTTATLTGISHSINLATGQADIAGIGKTVVPNFQAGSINRAGSYAQPTLVAHLRLAGMASGSRQVLTLLFTLIGDTVVSIETDLTQALKDFGKEINPLALDATIKLPNHPTDIG
ncbi:MAG: hypothetical protein RSC28_02200, partial [Bacteroidales bacterium]